MLKMKTSNLLTIIIIFAIGVALVNISVMLVNVSNMKKTMTGLATSTGEVNLTVETEISVNMSRDIINWGSGVVDPGQVNATLFTAEETADVSNGNWSTTNVKGMFLQNLGNINFSLNLTSDTDAAGLFGSLTSINELFMINVSNKDAGSCSNGTNTISTWYDVSTVAGGENYCGQLDYHSGSNSVYIDVMLDVPYDATNVSTELAATITATASVT